MLQDTNANVALTFEQLQQIETTKARLSNLESEIKIAYKEKDIQTKEVIKAIKEREYQEELKAKLEVEIQEKQQKLAGLEAAIATAQTNLTDVQTKTSKLENEFSTKDAELRDKAAELAAREQKLVEQEAAFVVKANEQWAEKEQINAIRATLAQAIADSKWK